jgi:hypothetical protein
MPLPRQRRVRPELVRWPCRLANGLDTALLITVLLDGLYVGVIPIGLHWHNQVLIELVNSLGLNCEH